MENRDDQTTGGNFAEREETLRADDRTRTFANTDEDPT
jgi:hypothetical protein